MNASSPTPYAEVNVVLEDLAARIQAILGSRFLALYVYGSLALGDFDPGTSDIDLVVGTQGEVPEEMYEALLSMHTDFDRSGSAWAKRVEAAYIPVEVLSDKTPGGTKYPQIERGTTLLRAPLENGWAFQRYLLREKGILVAGTDVRDLIAPVTVEEMQAAAAVITGGWLEQSRHDPGWIDWVRQREALSFVVLTLCRMLYSLENGLVVSKPGAAQWVQEKLDKRWVELIHRALAGQQDKGVVEEGEVEEMLALLAYTGERSR